VTLGLPVLFAAFAGSTPAIAGDLCYEWTVLNVDGDKPTSWFGLDESGTAIGNFCPADDCDPFDVDGALLDLSSGQITVIPNPLPPSGSQLYQPTDLNSKGEASVYAFDFVSRFGVAMVRSADGSHFTLPDIGPGVNQQGATGINNRGEVVGFSVFGDGPSRTTQYWRWTDKDGFSVVRSGLQGFEVASVGGINNPGTIAGALVDTSGVQHLFTQDRRGRTTLLPVSGAFVAVGDINEPGQIVGGTFSPPDFLATAWLYDPNDGYQVLDIPSDDAVAEGINNQGVIVGTSDFAFTGVIGTPCRGRAD